MTQATTRDYWISPTALHIELNAIGNPDYIQASCVSGAQILVYVTNIIGYDAGHNYRRWLLQAAPTVFNSHAEKYVYAAIPRDMTLAASAWIVFPSELIDIYGKNEKEEQIGNEKYYYINLQGIITSSGDNGTEQRDWKQRISTGYLSSDEAISAIGSDSEWYNYSNVDEIVTFLKDLTMKEGTKFRKLFANFINVQPEGSISFDGQGALTGIANSETTDTDNDKIVTPDFVSNRAISRLHDDSAQGLITFLKGITSLGNISAKDGVSFGNFFPGLLGTGGQINGEGRGEMRSLTLWEWLEVPELRYNRVSIYTGIRWDTFGGGIIEEIISDTTGADTGTGKLKLEEGEVGAISVGDLCMGIWHDHSGNSTENTDDNIGNFTFAGFKTIYFQITEVSGSNNEYFKYILRGKLEGGNGFHPFAGMHFAGRGNISNEERQAFSYTTTKYSVSLTGVNTWEFQPSNYYEIHGHLEGFSMPAVDSNGNTYKKVFHGYGQVFGNAYMFGQIDQFERISYRCYVEQSLGGTLAPGETEDVSVFILNGYGEDVTKEFTLINVTRNTGDEASDALWNAEHTNVGNPFQISFSDLGIDGIRKLVATFNVTASNEGTGQTAKAATATYFS